MKAWITGAGGMMGQHLTRFLLEKGYQVLATYYKPTTDIIQLPKEAIVEECDIRNRDLVKKFLNDFQPDEIYHLAAQSYPSVSWENPWYTIETNVLGSINLFEAVKELKELSESRQQNTQNNKPIYNPKILSACTSAEYGYVREDQVPVKETMHRQPLQPYGVSKLAQETLGYQYHKNFQLHIVNFRIFNTTGPFKANDVCADFTKRLVEIEKELTNNQKENNNTVTNQESVEKKLRVGNIETKRAITDVRDLIKAFHIGLQTCPSGEVYNLSGQEVYKISDIIETLRNLVDFEFTTYIDQSLIRPTDEPIIYGDSSKFKNLTNWNQEIPLEKTLKDMLDFWRRVL